MGSNPNQATFAEQEPNDSIAQAQNLDGSFVLTASTEIGDETSDTSQNIPHVTVFANGNNTFDYYRFTVNQVPATGFFDIDNTVDMDALITLFDSSGTQLAENDDAASSFGQLGSVTQRTTNGVAISLDSFLRFNFTQIGTFIIRVGEFDNANLSGSPVAVINGRYQLNVSIPNAIASSASNRLDVDANGIVDALTDGLLILRYLFGFRGSTLITGAVASNATRSSSVNIETYIASIDLDIDGNGREDALTDGLLILRFLFGFRGETLINGAVAEDAINTLASGIVTNLSQ